MQVSIIIPFYNVEPYIQACCESLLAQHYPEDRYEIIMIDNNSKDASAKIVSQYPRIKLLRLAGDCPTVMSLSVMHKWWQ